MFDIESIKILVNQFYLKIEKDALLRVFFVDIARVDWEEHLPTMYAFWDTILNGSGAYKGNPMAVHFPINRIKHLERYHFDQWLHLWTETCKETLYAEQAEIAIKKAQNIAGIMSLKMDADYKRQQGMM